MSRGINKIMIMGYLGVDPEVRYTPSGSAITNIRVATSESWKDRNTGEKQERTEWHRIVLFNHLGEISAQYLRKGSRVFVEGSIRTNKWKDQAGVDRYTTEIIASSMQLMDSKGDNNPDPDEIDYVAISTHGRLNGVPNPKKDGSVNYVPVSPQTPSSAHIAQAVGAHTPYDDEIPF